MITKTNQTPILIQHNTTTQKQTKGKAQLISNINACQAIADAVRTTLGPRGMDKLVADGRRVTISNDGATIMRLLEIEHPAAKTLVDISMSQVRRRCNTFFTCVVFDSILFYLLLNIPIIQPHTTNTQTTHK